MQVPIEQDILLKACIWDGRSTTETTGTFIFSVSNSQDNQSPDRLHCNLNRFNQLSMSKSSILSGWFLKDILLHTLSFKKCWKLVQNWESTHLNKLAHKEIGIYSVMAQYNCKQRSEILLSTSAHLGENNANKTIYSLLGYCHQQLFLQFLNA